MGQQMRKAVCSCGLQHTQAASRVGMHGRGASWPLRGCTHGGSTGGRCSHAAGTHDLTHPVLLHGCPQAVGAVQSKHQRQQPLVQLVSCLARIAGAIRQRCGRLKRSQRCIGLISVLARPWGPAGHSSGGWASAPWDAASPIASKAPAFCPILPATGNPVRIHNAPAPPPQPTKHSHMYAHSLGVRPTPSTRRVSRLPIPW